jgi:hypothetical protein
MMSLAEIVSVADRFHRSVNVTRDWRSGIGFKDYLVTPTARRLGERMLSELGEPNGTRAWSLIGPYGSGKSAFALFLAQLLCEFDPAVGGVEAIRGDADFDEDDFVPVLMVADRSPLQNRMALAIAEAFETVDPAIVDEARSLADEEEIRGENLAALLAFVAARAADRGFETVRIAVNNPFAYEALYRAGFAFTGEETGIAELVLAYPPPGRSRETYQAGLDLFRARGPDADERSFLDRKGGQDPPEVIDSSA